LPAAAFWSALCELGALAADWSAAAFPVEVEVELGVVALLPAAVPAAFCSVELVEDELLGVVLLLGAVWLWFIPEDVELELDGVVLVLELLGLVPAAAAPWSTDVLPVLVLLAAGVWLEAGGFDCVDDWSVLLVEELLGVVELLLGAVVDWLLLVELDGWVASVDELGVVLPGCAVVDCVLWFCVFWSGVVCVLLADGVVLVELGDVLVELCPTANPAHRTRAENVYNDFFMW
jgi:hypothetical protein